MKVLAASLLPELIHLIALKLNFRSLLNLRQTCKKYSALLNELVRMRREELFIRFTVLNVDTHITFVPGPAIVGLPKHFPITGIYFLNNDDGCVHFFFHSYYTYIMSMPHDHSNFIATINVKTKKVHFDDLGRATFGEKFSIRPCYNTFDVLNAWHNIKIYNAGKRIIEGFWKAL